MTPMTASLVEALSNPQAYPHPTGRIDLVQTHISWVFLAGDYAYKVKKPVDFGFLDFTTLEKRRFYCEEEVRLNRRLSPEIYLGVVPITLKGDGYAVQGAGGAVEYAVQMRCLPQERMMSHLLLRDQVTPAMIERLGRKVAEFHARAETSPEISRLGGPETARRNIEENFLLTEKFVGVTLTPSQFEETRAYCQGFLKEKAARLRERARQGYVRDGHGDLHAANVCFVDSLVIYDCIEFNERFRYGDVASDLAFMVMDLDYHGRPDLSGVLVAAYQEIAQDRGLGLLLPLFQCYRAYVRGKVASLTQADPGLPETKRRETVAAGRRYFALAHAYAGGSQPTLLITAGLIGTGKTALARGLAHGLGLAFVSSDVVRKKLAGLAPTERRFDPFGQGLYSPQATRATYDEMFRQAEAALSKGQSVVLDASFRWQGERARARELARGLGADFLVLECQAQERTIRERLARREAEGRSVSDGRREILPQIIGEFEAVTEVGPGQHYVVDTTGKGEDEVTREMLRRLPLFRLAAAERLS